MRRASASLAVLGLLAALLTGAGPASAASAGDEPQGELGAARGQLDGAARELSEIEQGVRRTNDEVAALDQQLNAASTELVAVTEELAAARAAAAGALDAERGAAARLSAADALLAGSLVDWSDHRGRMAARAVHAHKHGSTTTQDVLVRGVAASGDLHDVAVTLETVSRLAAEDRDLVEGSVATTRGSAALRAEVADLRAAAVATTKLAAEEAERVEGLVTSREQIVAELAAAHELRTSVLTALETDAAARAVLVQDLERRVASLELDARRASVSVDIDLDPFGPPPVWGAGLPGAGPTWAAAIDATAARHGIDGRLLAALVWTESGFRPDAVSHAGALGLTQLMPGTARGLGVDPRDPLANLDGGARFLRSQLDAFDRIDLALAAYNAGPHRVHRAGGVPDIVETQLYVVRVLERYQRLGG